MYDGFKNRTIRAIMLAQEEAVRLRRAFVTEELLLLGILSLGKSVSSMLLCSMGKRTPDQLYSDLEKIISADPRVSKKAMDKVPFSAPAKRVIQGARTLARQRKEDVNPEYLMLALLHVQLNGNTPIENLLLKVGIDPNLLRYKLVKDLDSAALSSNASIGETTTTPLLRDYGRELTCELIEPVIGRQAEVDRLIRILGRRKKAYPLLIGEAGVGKSAILRGLALRIKDDDVPDYLWGARLIEIDLLQLLAQSNGGTLLRACLEEATRTRVVLVLDEIHLLLSESKEPMLIAASGLLKRFMHAEKLSCIGIARPAQIPTLKTMTDSFSQFQRIIVAPPDLEETILIMKQWHSYYNRDLIVSDEVIRHAAALAEELLPGFLPDKSIDVLDEACVLAKLRAGYSSPLNSELRRVRQKKEFCIRTQAFQEASALIEQEHRLIDLKRQNDRKPPELTVSAEDVAFVVKEKNLLKHAAEERKNK